MGGVANISGIYREDTILTDRGNELLREGAKRGNIAATITTER